MKKLKTIATCLFSMAFAFNLNAQEENSYVHEQSDGYEWPTDKAVLEKLDHWQDQKFGVLFHWGLYSVPGICESWPLCSEDWITRSDEFTYEGYKAWYWGFSNVLNPTKFDPGQWADIMEDAGMKYMIFTTKHHDGFCMFDSKYTDFSIANGPFADDPRKDVARHVFDAFRAKDFMIGCYFSKPDWHCKWFWNPYYATPNRMQNYKRDQHPDWWKKYQDFTENQLTELMENYGKFDILWLDGGWITGEEVRLDNVLAKARGGQQKGLIAVDRTIQGKNENYQTPERSIPDRQIAHPWESCITLSHSWGWTPVATYKTPNEVVGILAEITAKGGCLLLGVGPTPEGLIQPEVEESLRGVGRWLRANGEAIYNTRITENYHDGNVWFTANKDGKTLYAIYTVGKDEKLPSSVQWTGNLPEGKMVLLKDGRTLKYTVKDGKVTVSLPKGLANEPLALRFQVKGN
ncbi:alpha-L-fucosidase [Phocaeicola sp.]|uniref:alpha-L-fucosidase n=1 Tax=Phocaeicola sp. TaxID=2773926 RepID=UPI0023C9A020|nr:alpha-L-fucosidase [Phocaeicola sp.]MDE5676633.1 alpha-L-fucosidase [Phocaeicola sp.]